MLTEATGEYRPLPFFLNLVCSYLADSVVKGSVRRQAFTCKGQYKQTNPQRHIHALSVIQTHDLGVSAAEDSTRLRPRDGVGLCMQHHTVISSENLFP